MKKISLFLSLMFCMVIQAWAGSAVTTTPDRQTAAPFTAVKGIKSVDFTPGTMVTDVASISEGYAYVIRSARGFLLNSANFPNHIAGSAGSGVEGEGNAAYDVEAQQFQFKTNGTSTYLYI